MIAFAYLRVSSRGQVDGDGFKRQADSVWSFCEREGHSLGGTFFDAGVTGTVADRPGVLSLVEHVARFGGGSCCVVVEGADRLARDVMASEMILQQFRELGVVVLTASGVDLTESDDPSRNLVRQMLAAVAEYDKRALVAKLRAARERARAEKGRCEGAKPFGSFQHERKALDEILMLRSWGWTYSQIAGHMNKLAQRDRDMLPRRGGKWYKGVVHAIVRANSERETHASWSNDPRRSRSVFG